MFKPALLAVLLLLAVSVRAGADPAPIWFAASGSFNTYDMSELNEQFDGFQTSIEGVEPSFGFGFGVGMDLSAVRVSLGYERLLPSVELTQGQHYDASADVLVGRVAWRLGTIGTTVPRLGVGVGVAFASGGPEPPPSAPFHATDPRVRAAGQAEIFEFASGEVSGSAPYFEGTVQAETPLGGAWSLEPALGYRWARAEVGAEGSPERGDVTFDYGGLAVHLAVRYTIH